MKYKVCFIIIISALFWGCDSMDATYREFLRDGEVIYVGTADSVGVFPGKNRLKMRFLISDPTATGVRILWNNKTDSLVIPVQRIYQTDTIATELTGLSEGSYSFDIITFDEDGNTSVKVNAVGNVYGEHYANSLLDTPVKGAYVNEADETSVDVHWGAADETSLGSEVIYTDSFDETHMLFVPSGEQVTVLTNYLHGSSFQYRTLYLPEKTAIDTFYTAFRPAKVKGVAVEYAKTSWVASGNDYDTGNLRPPKNAIDNKANTVWHMSKTITYPQIMSVDMGEENTVSGFSFLQRLPLNAPLKLIEIKISSDGVVWSTLGEFTLGSVTTVQYLDLSVDVHCRHFMVIAKSDYGNGNFTALAEVGAYRR